MRANAEQRRRRELAQIHIAKAALQLDEDTYRDMLFTLARVRSAADLDFAGRRRVIEHLKSRGWRPQRSRQSRHAHDPVARKALALWLDLRDRGLISDASSQALAAFCRRVTGIERLEWMSSEQLAAVIEGLKAWSRR
ncbi:MAG TPA: regulatory protein GemA [Burkholderiales bacterium]|nr:regulatory protein GemA [Burkholderiales bacterium]